MNIAPSHYIKLNIGGTEPRDGWSILNAVPGPHVTYVGNCTDLSFLPDECCTEVYASHVLEHVGHNGDLQTALRGIFRVLRPGGRFRVSVPDLEILCKLFLDPVFTVEQRYQIMLMMYGARVDQYDIHQCGLTFEFLSGFMEAAGFVHISRTGLFEDFNDTNQGRFCGHLISLNMEGYSYYK